MSWFKKQKQQENVLTIEVIEKAANLALNQGAFVNQQFNIDTKSYWRIWIVSQTKLGKMFYGE